MSAVETATEPQPALGLPEQESPVVAGAIGNILFIVYGALAVSVAAAGAGYILLYVTLGILRVPYPYELEWLEGGMVQEVERIIANEPIYTAATLEYAPFLYTPLYFYMCVPFYLGLGPGYMPLRLVAFLASLGVFALLYRLVQKETGNHFAALLAAGLYAATFRIGGAWFDIARVDSPLLLLLLAGIYVARFYRSTWSGILLALLLSAAFLTKQSAIAVILPILLGVFLFQWRQALVAGILTTLILGVATWILNVINNGWYWYYFFNATTVSGFVDSVWVTFWTEDIAASFGMTAAFAVVGLGVIFSRGNIRVYVLYGLVTVGIIAMSYISRLHVGGYYNVVMPTYAWLALLAAIAVHHIAAALRTAPPRFRYSVLAAVQVTLLLQFALLLYDPAAQVPSKADRIAGDRLMDLIATTEGPVFMPYHNYLPALAGKKTYANKAGINGVLDDREHPQRAEMISEIATAINNRHFGLVIMDNRSFFARELRQHYREVPFDFGGRDVFYPVTGMRTRPVVFYVPKEPAGEQGRTGS